VRELAGRGFTANEVTLGACALSLALGAALWVWSEQRALYLLLAPCLLLRMALNAVDGMLAREFGQKSALGAFLNELCDVISDAALYLPFARLPHFGWPAVTFVILLAALGELAGTIAPMVGAERRYDGPFGKSDRAAAFGALGLAIGLGLPPATWLGVVFPVLGLLGALTVANRVRGALAEIAPESPHSSVELRRRGDSRVQ
jgi:CDP-diacylglycerol--glycerol-3-phosphate 3-phosphatidyltransferase